MELIDFSNTFLKWMTKKEESIGRFSIVAQLDVGNESYFLCKGVMAGNVYDLARPAQVPSYWYQAVFSDQGNFKIFRLFENFDRYRDSIAKTTELFEKVEWSIERKQGQRLITNEQVADAINTFKKLVVRVSYKINQLPVQLTIPVEHINYSQKRNLFQIETGPIMILEKEPAGIQQINLGYIFINTFTAFTCLNLGANESGKNTYRRFSKEIKQQADIEIYSLVNN